MDKDKLIFMITRMLHPNWLSISYFTEGWDFFFQQEFYSLSVLFSLGTSETSLINDDILYW